MKSRMADGFFLDIELCRDAVNTHCPAIYRNAVPAYSPGLPVCDGLPWGTDPLSQDLPQWGYGGSRAMGGPKMAATPLG